MASKLTHVGKEVQLFLDVVLFRRNVCFHDVDYLPIRADYRYADDPTMLVWYGMQTQPADPKNPHIRHIIYAEMEEWAKTGICF